MEKFKTTWTALKSTENSIEIIDINHDVICEIICPLYVTEEAIVNSKKIEVLPEIIECLTKLVEAHESDNTKEYGFWTERGRFYINKALGL